MSLDEELLFGFTKKEYDLLLSHLNKNKVLLEYGCGLSTLKLSNHVEHLHSIEHAEEWYLKIKNELRLRNIKNVSLNLIEPNIKSHEYSYFWYDCQQLNEPIGLEILNDYINFQKNIKFDDIFIDGRSRLFCADVAFDLLQNNSYLIFHDFENRPYYHACLNKYKIINKVDTLYILSKL